MDHFIANLSDKAAFRRVLLELKHSQDDSLYTLEQEYLCLVRDRRTALINYLKSSSQNKRQVIEGLKEMHTRTQAEFDAFLKVRVYDGWQSAQLASQIETLHKAGISSALLNEREGISYLQTVMEYLLIKL